LSRVCSDRAKFPLPPEEGGNGAWRTISVSCGANCRAILLHVQSESHSFDGTVSLSFGGDAAVVQRARVPAGKKADICGVV